MHWEVKCDREVGLLRVFDAPSREPLQEASPGSTLGVSSGALVSLSSEQYKVCPVVVGYIRSAEPPSLCSAIPTVTCHEPRVANLMQLATSCKAGYRDIDWSVSLNYRNFRRGLYRWHLQAA